MKMMSLLCLWDRPGDKIKISDLPAYIGSEFLQHHSFYLSVNLLQINCHFTWSKFVNS